MPFVAAPNCVQMNAIYSLAGENVENTFHYRLPAPATNANLVTALNALFGWFTVNLSNFCSDLSLIKGYARALDTASSPTLELNPVPIQSGTITNPALPNNVTFAITRYSGLAGRRNRGRVYYPGVPQEFVAATNDMASGAATGLVTMYNDLRVAMVGLTPAFTEIILHRADGTHVDVAGYRFSDLILDSQRRRLPGHNRHD